MSNDRGTLGGFGFNTTSGVQMGGGFGFNKRAGGTPDPAIANVYSILFDGVDEYVNCGNSLTIKPETGMTVSCWVKPRRWAWLNPGGALDHSEFLVGNIAVGGWGLYIQFAGTQNTPTTTIIWKMKVNGPTPGGGGSPGYVQAEIPSAIARTFTSWVFLVAAFDGDELRLTFTDTTGVVGSQTYTTATEISTYTVYSTSPTYSGVDVLIGADPINNPGGVSGDSPAADFLNGYLDEVGIWDIGLGEEAVASLYNVGVPTNLGVNINDYTQSSNLQGWWRNGDTGGQSEYPSIEDYSTNTNDGLMHNMESSDINTNIP